VTSGAASGDARPRARRPRAAPSWSRTRAVPLLLSAFIVLSAVSWLMGTAPGGAPDEGAHYVKAIGVGHGDLYGRRAPHATVGQFLKLTPAQESALARLFVGQARLRSHWQGLTTRAFEVPGGLTFDGFFCTALRPDGSAQCLAGGRRSAASVLTPTYVGTYQPYAYVLPGLLMRAASGPLSAMRLGRLGIAVVACALLVAAAWLLWDGGRGALAIAGLVVAVTPTAVYFASTLNPSGIEIAAAVCFAAALLRICRAPRQPASVWALLGASGFALAVARSLGPAFVVAILAAVVLVFGRRPLTQALRSGGRRASGAAVAVLAGMVAGAGWEAAAQPHTHPALGSVGTDLGWSLSQLGSVFRQAVGVFGAIDAPLPPGFVAAWYVLTLVLLGVAVATAGRTTRVRFLVVVAATVAAVGAIGIVTRPTGFAVQGRYVLPLLAGVALIAAEVVSRSAGRVPRRAGVAVGVAGVVAAVVHAAGWWTNAQRFAVGRHGPWYFLDRARWSPPGGWPPWTVLALSACVCLLAAGLALGRAVDERRRVVAAVPR